jgi:hypothetical protein
MTRPEALILAEFRARYVQAGQDLDAFTNAYASMDFEGWTVQQIGRWCRDWWETRLAGRAMDDAQRKIRGAQGQN